jgi:hypothetical protein
VDPTAEELLWCSFAGGTTFAMVDRARAGAEATFDEGLPTCEDWDLYARCARLGSVVVVSEVLVRVTLQPAGEGLTRQLDARDVGHRRFLERHRTEMTGDCVAYHGARARIRAAATAGDKVRLLPSLAQGAPPIVRRALLTESIAGRIGAVRDDPALSMRQLLRVLRSRR